MGVDSAPDGSERPIAFAPPVVIEVVAQRVGDGVRAAGDGAVDARGLYLLLEPLAGRVLRLVEGEGVAPGLGVVVGRAQGLIPCRAVHPSAGDPEAIAGHAAVAETELLLERYP